MTELRADAPGAGTGDGTVYVICNHVGSEHARRANRKIARLIRETVGGGGADDLHLFVDAGTGPELRLSCTDCRIDVDVTEIRLREIMAEFDDAGAVPVLLPALVSRLARSD